MMPVQISARLGNYAAAISGLQYRELSIRTIPARVMRAELETARKDLVEPYPPELANQRYRRTYNRQRRTRVEPYAGNNQYVVRYRLVSDPLYRGRSADPYVIGNAQGSGQASIHAGRWRLIFDVVREAVDRAFAAIEQGINRPGP